jgi:hypothetical protein
MTNSEPKNSREIAPRASTRDQVLAAFLSASPDALSDAELGARLPHLHRGQYSPARVRLYRAGRVELAGKNDDGVELWRAVTDPDRYAEVAEQAQQRPLRRVTWDRADPEAKAAFILRALGDSKVRAAIDEARASGRGARRAKAESRRETQAEQRERKARLKQAQKDKDALLDFLKVHDHLRDAVLAMSGIRAFLAVEQARLNNAEPWRIPPRKWPQVYASVTEVLEDTVALRQELGEWLGIEDDVCPACGHTDAPEIGQGYIDIDETDVIVDATVID